MRTTKCDLQYSNFAADYTRHKNLSLNSHPFFLCSVKKGIPCGVRASNPPGEQAFPFIPFPSWQMTLLIDENKAVIDRCLTIHWIQCLVVKEKKKQKDHHIDCASCLGSSSPFALIKKIICLFTLMDYS